MSDSEEDFRLNEISDYDDSEGYVPNIKKASRVSKVAKSASAPKKAAAKAKSAPKKIKAKIPLKEIHDNGSDSEPESGKDEPLNPAHNTQMDRDTALPVPNKGKTAHEKYKKLDHHQHILQRPDSYVGSVEPVKQHMWVFDKDTKKLVFREVQYVPAFLKIFDEILVNAADHKINDPSMDTIKVWIEPDRNFISVYNNGSGIEIVIHDKHKSYIPYMIFGELLTGSNYDDDERKVTGGRNGFGAKLTNIYSREFTVETADRTTSQIYKQTWCDNMFQVGKPKITSNSKDLGYTQISFKPDLARFQMDSIDSDTEALLMKRVYDMAGSVKDVKVWLNGEKLKIKNFKSYVDLYLAPQQGEENDTSATKPQLLYERINPRWEIAFALSEGSFQHVSFANSISTTKGGTHVSLIADQIAKYLLENIQKKNKGATIRVPQIKNQMWLFVNALVENPTFDSQTKETLTLPASKFGGAKAVISEEFLKKVAKSGIIDNVLSWASTKADQQAKKTDGSKRTRVKGLAKLCDANNAGGRGSSKCTLILTEGDSAKALAVAGLAVVGRDNFGVFPLRGKLLNVREAKHETWMKNEEISNIKKIMGLQHNKKYDSVDSLRYGSVMIMTDQDHDGSHIKGLLINFFDCFYPSLLQIPNFLVEFITPIVRVWKKRTPDKKLNFFTLHQFKDWYERQNKPDEWHMKYYKGLGTSTEEDGRSYFSQMEKHMISFGTATDEDRKAVDLAFSKKMADARKDWLRELEPDTFLDHDTDEISIADFVNKELILFSMADNVRSIPSIVDGYKPVQRKILWTCFKRNQKKQIKVAQLCGAISELSNYHHGEESLTQSIVNLAQDFVGSNNISVLAPEGQYGTRNEGGRDHASARYLHTELTSLARKIFHPADDPLLEYLVEEGQPIEPRWYLPILPHVLVNGAEGIGTGWSTNIPCYNPVDVINNLRHMMRGEPLESMTPWWKGFKGNMIKTGEQKWQSQGIAQKLNDTTVEITELPIHRWTTKFKVEIESMIEDKGDSKVKDYKEHHNNLNVHFTVTMSPQELQKAEEQGFVEYFKLYTQIHTSNMICFDFDGKIKRYASPEQIIEEFYPKRLAYYQKRKDHLANALQREADKISNQIRFVRMIVDGRIKISNRKKADIVDELRSLKFDAFPKVSTAKKSGETIPALDDEESEEENYEVEKFGNSTDFDYLLGMPLWSLTKEKIDKLLKQMHDKEEELKRLLGRPPIDIWNEDLDAFLAEWEETQRRWLVAKVSEGKQKIKQATLRTRKSIGKGKKVGRGSDEDDDFAPVRKRAKIQPNAGERVAKMPGKAPEAKGPGEATETSGKPRAPTKMQVDSDDDLLPQPVKAKQKDEDGLEHKAAKKGSNTLDDFLVKDVGTSKQKISKKMNPRSPPKKARPKTGGRAKVVEISDSDNNSPEVVPVKRPGRAATRAPAKYVEVSSDGDEIGDDGSFQLDD